MSFFPYIVLNGGDLHHMMDDWPNMMHWWGIPYFGYWTIIVWIIQLILAFMVYKDAENKKENGILWFILVIIPWIGLLFLIGYLVIREEETDAEEAIENAEKILDERYVKGEITRKEYLQMKKDIKKIN